MSARVVAIDGAAGSGKSTLARGLAHALGMAYVNTGLMYRALTRAAIVAGIDDDDVPGLTTATRTLTFDLDDGDPPELTVGGVRPGAELETAEVEAHVSRIAAHPEVRALMHAEQRRLGEAGVVMEGRDIGSVVFPDAPVTIYLLADPVVRAARRALERPADGSEPDGGRVEHALHERDRRDMEVNAFEAPPGGTVIDTTDLDVEGTVETALRLIRAEAPELLG
jgi:cytidylate kinase